MKIGTVLIALAAVVLLAPRAPAALAADGENDYAYVFVQGRIIDPTGTEPLVGASIRMKSDADSYEATTDQKGVFIFEKLPVATYEMTVTAPDGRVTRTLQRIDPGDPDRARLKARLGYGPGAIAVLEPNDGQVDVIIPDPPSDWPRFWKQFAIFVGTAGLLAL